MQAGFVAAASLLLATLALHAGCGQKAPVIPMGEPAPLKSALSSRRTNLIENRYLLLPVAWKAPKGNYSLMSGGFSGASWSGIGMGSTYGDHWLNLRVIDLQEERERAVFERQVALGGWSKSLDSRGELALRTS